MQSERDAEKAEIIKDILSRFQSGFPKFIDCGNGWSEIIMQCHKELKEVDENYTIAQIKEKFGGLRYYFASTNPALYAGMCKITSKYMDQSFKICEMCGKPGELRNETRLRTLCEKHKNKES